MFLNLFKKTINTKPSSIARTTLTLAVLTGLAGCGGGNGDSTSATANTATGVFLDSAVSGLDYVSGDIRGVTGADGSFTYEVGKNVSFSLGGVNFGTAAGGDIVTPIDLVPNGDSSTTAVLNITRFLIGLDSDGNPDNGITIPDAVKKVASNWTQPDFSLTEANFDAAVNGILSDISIANGGRSIILPTTIEARSHLETTFFCAHAGAYAGRMSGGYNGNFAAIVNGTNGRVVSLFLTYPTPGSGPLYWDNDRLVQALSQDGNLSFNSSTPNFIFDENGFSITLSSPGRLNWPDGISGTWNHARIDPDAVSGYPLIRKSGRFSGTRLATADNSAYRFVLRYLLTENAGQANANIARVGVMSFGIDANNKVSGEVYSLKFGGQPLPITGTLSGLNLSISVPSTGDSLHATLTKDIANSPRKVKLQADYTVGNTTYLIRGTGCLANP